MAKGRKKRRNKRREMPPLSLLDKCIYWISGVIAFGGLAALFVWLMGLGERLAFENEDVLAVSRHPSLAWMFPGLFSLALTFCGLILGNYEARQPIFGKSGVYYGPPLPKRYPLFWKDKPEQKPREKRFRSICAALVLGINMLCILPMPWSVQGRSEWHADGSVVEYNMLGDMVAEYETGDAEQVQLVVHSYWRSKSWGRHYVIRIQIQMEDGAFYVFSAGEFRSGEQDGICRWLADMQALLQLYPNVEIRDTELLELAIEDQNLNEAEAALLRHLFGEG